MKGSYKVLRIRGINVKLHFTFLLLLPVLVLSFALDIGGDLISIIYSLGIFTALFGSVLMHELTHSFVAMRNGIEVKQIILTPIGGIASMGMMKTPSEEFKVSIAGPLSNFALGFLMLSILISFMGTDAVADAIFSRDIFYEPSAINFVIMFTYLNLILGAFNLFLPIFPMDGGRVLRSMLGMITDHLTATKVAVTIGQAFLGVFIVFSFLAGSIFLIAIGVFLFLAGISELRVAEIGSILEKADLEKFMKRDVVCFSPELQLADARKLSVKQGVYPVLTKTGKAVGVVMQKGLSGSGKVKDAMIKEFPRIWLSENREEVFTKVYPKGYAVVVNKTGIFQGFITLKLLGKAIKSVQKTP